MFKVIDKKTKILLITLILCTFLLLGGLTYAYFSAIVVVGNNTHNAIVVQTATYGEVVVTYDQDNEILDMNNTDLSYVNKGIHNYDYIKFKIDYTGNVNQDVYIYWKDVVNTFCDYANTTTQECTGDKSDTDVRNEMNYSVYECNSLTNYNNATNTTLTGCTLVNTLNTPMPRTGTNDYLLTSKKVTLNSNTKYYIVVGEMRNLLTTQDYNQGSSFLGKVWVELEDPYFAFNTKTASYQNTNVLGYKLLTDQNTTKYNGLPTLTKAAVSRSQYNEAPTSLTDCQTKVCDNTSKYYDAYYCSVCTEGHDDYDLSKCTIYFNNNTQSYQTTEENGLFKAFDDNGVTYYYRGVNENNYVSFAGFTWRVIRINNDGSIRMILDGLTSTVKQEGNASFAGSNAKYNVDGVTGTGTSNAINEADTAREFASYDGGELETAINTFYTTYLTTYGTYLTDNLFCSDNSWGEPSGAAWKFSPYTRLGSGNATFNCDPDYRYTAANTKLSNPIATMNVEEVNYAGAKYYTSNYNYYLNNSTTINIFWWTMSPYAWDDFGSVYAYRVFESGSFHNNSVAVKGGIRPVINLKADTVVTGSGTSTTPYQVS